MSEESPVVWDDSFFAHFANLLIFDDIHQRTLILVYVK